MSFVDAYDKQTGKKLPYLVPEHHIDHPILGRRLARLPSSKKTTAVQEPARKAGKNHPTETPDTGNKE